MSSLRRFVTFGCFRNYELGMQTIKDIFLACCSIGSRVFAVVLADLRALFESTEDLDLRWANEAVLNDAVAWCSKMSHAQKVEGSATATYFQEFVDALTQLLTDGPIHLSKASLMLAIEDLEPTKEGGYEQS